MNKLIFVLLVIFISCKSSSQDNTQKSSIETLRKSFSEKNEQQYLEYFPKDFKTFKNIFGWNEKTNTPQPLYKESKNYIQYFFSLLQKPQNKKYEFAIISISANATWEADAINYFQDYSLNYIKNNNSYYLINSLNNNNAKAVLSFLFEMPLLNIDTDFIKNLDKEKKGILHEISSRNLSPEARRSKASMYENDENNFIKYFDVNKDGIFDKIVSSKPYQGSDLFIFYGTKKGEYKIALETTNFSEDGGNIIKDIVAIPNKKGLQITTSFPDKGYYEKVMTLVPENNSWFLKKIIYKTMSGMSEDAVTYICDVPQNIDITKSGWSDKIIEIPAEDVRSRKCKIEIDSKKGFTSFINDPDGYTNLRKKKNTASEILQKIKSGEQVEVLDGSEDWYLIQTKEGKQGYVHKSRVKSID